MSYLPPGEPATRADLEAFEGRIDARFAGIEGRFEVIDARFDELEARFNERIDLKFEAWGNGIIATVRKEMMAQTRLMIVSMVTAVAAVGGLAVAAR